MAYKKVNPDYYLLMLNLAAGSQVQLGTIGGVANERQVMEIDQE